MLTFGAMLAVLPSTTKLIRAFEPGTNDKQKHDHTSTRSTDTMIPKSSTQHSAARTMVWYACVLMRSHMVVVSRRGVVGHVVGCQV